MENCITAKLHSGNEEIFIENCSSNQMDSNIKS